MEWTHEQREAIIARNHTLLVSAAAGSGKTAVLVERIVQLIREGYALDRMLIVTFTRAAAGEMRQRLANRLVREAQHDAKCFGKALDALEQTDISTIHAFCHRVLRQEFQAVGIDPMARVCEEQQRQELFNQSFRLAMNELLEEDHLAFHRLVCSFSQAQLLEMTENLYRFLLSMPNPFIWLEKKIQAVHVEHMTNHPWFMAIMEQIRLEVEGLSDYLLVQHRMWEEPCAVPVLLPTFQQDVQTVRALRQAAQQNEQLIQALRTTSFVRAATCRGLTEEQKAWKERYTALRDTMKQVVKNLAAMIPTEESTVLQEMDTIQSSLQGLSLLVQRVHEHFLKQKNEEGLLDFSDLEQMTMQVLSFPECRQKLQEDYDHIFVDECQDVSAVQDAIIQGIHGQNNCLFMVGDVKQSIYRFRLADPTLFLRRMRTFSDAEDAEERRIFLQKNFRSRSAVLQATNQVFRRAMKKSVTELDYMPEDELICGRETEADPPVEVHLVQRATQEKSAARHLENEAAVVTRRIQQLLQTTWCDEGVERPYAYRDMVILLQKKAGVGARLAELLEEQGIPVYFDGTDHYYDLPEIRTIKAILEVIDNPLQDVYLITAMKAMPFCLTDRQLADIRACKTGRDVPFWKAFTAACQSDKPIGAVCRAFQNKQKEWRFRCETMRLSDLVWFVLRDSGFYAACGAYPEGELRQANLRLLCQKAAVYEQQQHGGLSGFLRMVHLQMQQSDSMGAKVLGEHENLVRIMTMHKSKGLEFPVVFCMGLSERLTGTDTGVLHTNSQLGLCLPYVNPTLNIRRPGLGEDAFQYRKRMEEMSERCRLLYVAMTRARERLILIGRKEEKDEENWTLSDTPYRVWSAHSMMDWIMQTLCDLCDGQYPQEGQAPEPWQLYLEPDEGISHLDHPLDGEMAAWVQQVVSVPAKESAFSWWNTPEKREKMPIKTSVSSLTRRVVLHDPLPLGDEDETLEDKRASEEIVAPLRLSEIPARPAFLEKKRMTGAEHGTLMHRFLSLTPLEPLRGLHGAALQAEIAQQAAQMQADGRLSQQEMDMLHLMGVCTFFESKLGQRLLAAKEVHREWSFNLRLQEGEIAMLQGIMDCAFLEKDAWVLLDYKTDHIVSEEAFVERHCLQLNWYARALEQITGRAVKEKWLYALTTGKAYEVKREKENCFP